MNELSPDRSSDIIDQMTPSEVQGVLKAMRDEDRHSRLRLQSEAPKPSRLSQGLITALPGVLGAGIGGALGGKTKHIGKLFGGLLGGGMGLGAGGGLAQWRKKKMAEPTEAKIGLGRPNRMMLRLMSGLDLPTQMALASQMKRTADREHGRIQREMERRALDRTLKSSSISMVEMIKSALAKNPPLKMKMKVFDPASGATKNVLKRGPRSVASAAKQVAAEPARSTLRQMQRVNYLRNKWETARRAAGGAPKPALASAVKRVAQSAGGGAKSVAGAVGGSGIAQKLLGTMSRHPLLSGAAGLGLAGLAMGLGRKHGQMPKEAGLQSLIIRGLKRVGGEKLPGRIAGLGTRIQKGVGSVADKLGFGEFGKRMKNRAAGAEGLLGLGPLNKSMQRMIQLQHGASGAGGNLMRGQAKQVGSAFRTGLGALGAGGLAAGAGLYGLASGGSRGAEAPSPQQV